MSTPPPPIPIQLAVQGGGAKICALMAAMEAVQALEEAGLVRVTRIAATSAGSIVAGLYAAGHDFPVLRQRIRDNRRALSRLIPKQASAAGAVFRMLRGQPVWSLEPLRSKLELLFREKQAVTLGDLRERGKELIITATDLTNGKLHTYERDDDPVVNAIIDSCSIPYAFRGPGRRDSGSLMVDGGICENLPVSVLQTGAETYGVVVGITFSSWRAGRTPSGVLSFSRALLDAAMNNSVQRARQLLGGRVFSIDTNIDTLDFDHALKAGFDDAYTVVRDSADRWLREFLRGQAGDEEDEQPIEVWDNQDPVTLQQHAQIYRAQHGHKKMKYLEATVTATVNALHVTNGQYFKQPDEVAYMLRFQPTTSPVGCHRVAFVQGEGMTFLRSSRVRVHNRNGDSIRTIDLLARDPDDPTRRAYLLFFDPVLEPQASDAPYTLRYAHRIAGLMRPLVEERRDVVALRLQRAEGVIDRIVFIVFVPEEFQDRVRVRPAEITTGTNPGRPLSEQEIATMNVDARPGYHALGWIGEGIDAATTFGAEVVLV